MATQLAASQSSKTAERSTLNTARSFVKTDDRVRGEKQMTTYQAAQQVKYLHLQAEIDVLLQELQAMEKQKQQNGDWVAAQRDRA